MKETMNECGHVTSKGLPCWADGIWLVNKRRRCYMHWKVELDLLTSYPDTLGRYITLPKQ